MELMFRHVVMFKWTEAATEEQKRNVSARLAQLPDAIPELKAYHFGPDVGINDGNYDFVVVADFADRAAYLSYRDNPEHRAAVDEAITPIRADRAAVQYEL
jgi:hypothetical protein